MISSSGAARPCGSKIVSKKRGDAFIMANMRKDGNAAAANNVADVHGNTFENGRSKISTNSSGRELSPESNRLANIRIALCAMFKKPAIAIAAAGIGIGALPSATSKGAVLLDGTTRAQMTADNPALDGFFANASGFIAGIGQSPNNASVTHLWGQYYAIAAHEVQDGVSFGNLYTGRDYVTDDGNPIGIASIAISPDTDFAIITANVADNTPRDPNSKLVGIVVAGTSSLTTIYDTLSGPENLAFINQVTGSNITEAEILSGQSIIAAPGVGDHVWSDGYGAWGTPSGGLNNPDGNPGQWQGPYVPNGAGLNGAHSDPQEYFAISFVNDGGLTNGPLNGYGAQVDSGSPGIITVSVPEPGSLALAAGSMLALLARRQRKST